MVIYTLAAPFLHNVILWVQVVILVRSIFLHCLLRSVWIFRYPFYLGSQNNTKTTKHFECKLHILTNNHTNVKKLQNICILFPSNGCIYLICTAKKLVNCTSSTEVYTILSPSLAEHDMPCLSKQCRSRSVGFWRSQLIWICTVCH